MAEYYRSLEWLQRRKEGEPVGEIADRAGVPVELVVRATDPYGPFPGGRVPARPDSDPRSRAWVEQRRRGIRVIDIAAAAGVPHQTVSKTTLPYGPFPRAGSPTEDQIRTWVTARRSGTSIIALARRTGQPAHAIARATRPHGPFRVRFSRTPDGLSGHASIAARLGVAHPTVLAWDRRGYLPPPDYEIAGRRLWREVTITAWLPHSGLAACPTCGAWTRQPRIHHSLAHQADALE